MHFSRQAEHIALGEECSYRFVKSALEVAIDQWNHAIEGIKAKSPEELVKLCELPPGTDDVESHLQEVETRMSRELLHVSVKATDNNFMSLALVTRRFCCVYCH